MLPLTINKDDSIVHKTDHICFMSPLLQEEGDWWIFSCHIFLEEEVRLDCVPHYSIGFHQLNSHLFWMWREHLTRKSEDLSSHPVFSIYYQPDDCGHMQFCSLNFNVFICKIEMFLPVTISLMDITLGESNKITYAKEICKSRLLQMCYIFHFCLAKSWGLGFYRTDVTVKKGPRNLDIQIKYSYFNHLFNVICQNCG